MKYFRTEFTKTPWDKECLEAFKARNMDVLELKKQNEQGRYIAKNDFNYLLERIEDTDCQRFKWGNL